MGVNTNTYLPGTVETDDLVLAIQRLTDADYVTLRTFDNGRTSWTYSRGDDHFFGPHEMYDLLIERKDGFGDGEIAHSGGIWLKDENYADTPEGSPNKWSMEGAVCVHGGNASAFWCALGEGLVALFGGEVDYNDCDAVSANTKRPKTRFARNNGREDRSWDAFEKKLSELEPVTQDLRAFDKVRGIWNRKGELRDEKGRVYRADR